MNHSYNFPLIRSSLIFFIVFALAVSLGFGFFTIDDDKNAGTPQAFAQTSSTDWPQLQHDSYRSGFTSVDFNVQNIRPRWIWFGSDWVLRNRQSESLPTWDDDLTSAEGKSLSMPSSVPFTFAESMQPIIVNNKVFVGDTTGKVYALNLFDGSSLWQADNPGGTAWPGVATANRVVFGSHFGFLTAWDTNTGTQIWQLNLGKTISHAPALDGDTVYVASQNGTVYAVNLSDGKILWQTNTGAPIQGGIAIANQRLYLVNEAMYAIGLHTTDGKEFGRTKLVGQSFRRSWPVITQGKVIIQTVQLPFVGSEYTMNEVITGSDGSFANEQTTVRNWLQNDGWMYEDLFVLDALTLSKPFTVSNGAVGGVGHHADPPVILSDGRALTYWPTYFGTVMTCSFGCPTGYDIDFATINLTNGNGVQLRSSGSPVTGVETDNTFGLTLANNTLFMRQAFRGTKALNLSTFQTTPVSAIYRYRDCGGWHAALNYANGQPGCPPSAGDGVTVPSHTENFAGHAGPAIVPGYICFTESFALTCMED